MRRVPLAPVLLAAATLLAPIAVRAEIPDKNGVAPTVISLPGGPGSLEGLGESFQPLLNTGMASYNVPIRLPAGTNGHTPPLVLRYDSGEGHGPAGLGWKYGPGGIRRRTDQGLPRYVDGPNGLDDDGDGRVDEADETDAVVGPDGEDLVDFGDGVRRARIEGGFVRYRRAGDRWEADLRDGSRLEFGTTPSGRVADPSGTHVFHWLPERHTDANGNVIEYRWASFDGSDGQRYLSEIRYGPGAPPWAAFYFVAFAYEERPDPRDDYRPGFLVRTAARLSRVDVGIQGTFPDRCAVGDHNADGIADALVSRYTLGYDDSAPRHSLLSAVTRYGSDGVNRLPPVSFGYSTFQPALVLSAAGAVIGSENAPPTVMDSGLAELVDLNRDGLPDILRTDLAGGPHTVSLNLGEVVDGSRRFIRWDAPRAVVGEDGLAQALHLAEDRVSLADMDGDGLADLVHYTEGGEVRYHSNRGTAAWGPRVLLDIAGTAPPAPFTRDDVAVTDLDGDGRTDILLSTATGYSGWLDLDGSVFGREFRTAGARWQGEVIQFATPGVQMADVNGDRLNDVALITPTLVVCAPAKGHGEFAPAVEMPITDVVLTDGDGGQVGRAKLADLNGDGLADLAIERAAPGELWFWLNRGDGSFSRRHLVTDLPAVFGADTAVRWADMNGNGTTDLAWADSTAQDRVRVLDIGLLAGGSAHPNLLTRIDNGLGLAADLTWSDSTAFYLADREAGEPWTSTVPFPVQVVAGVANSSGLDMDGETGPDVYRKEFRYRDGFYEDREKAFRGFARVEVTELGDATAPSRVSRNGFFTGGPDGVDNDGDGTIDEISPEEHREEEALKGMPAWLETRSAGGTVFDREENGWRVRNLLVSPGGVEVRFAWNARRDRVIVEGTEAPEILRTDFAYDDFGNLTEERNLGALSISGDEAFTFTDHVNDTSRWVLGKPWRVRVTDGAGARVRETFHYYDGTDFLGLPSGSLTRGNLTRTTGWVAGDEYADLVRHARDAWGNVSASLSPTGFRRSVTWDALLRVFPVREDVEVGGGEPDLVAAAGYHAGLGVLTAATGFDGRTTEYGYDVFGRLTSVVRPGDSAAYPSSAFTYVMADPGRGLTWAYDADGVLSLTAGPPGPSTVRTASREVSGEAGTYDVSACIDGLGRSLATVGEGETGFVASGATRFNSLGTRWRSYQPSAAGSDECAAPAVDDPATEYRYDAAGREVLRINPPDDAGSPSQAAVEYLPLRRAITDEEGKRRTHLYDGLGRVIETKETNGAEEHVTRFAYDPLGRPTGTTDALGNTSSKTWDGLGRLVLADDPDRGRTSYRYDAAGNLIGSTDNKGQRIFYTYDGANRLVAEHHFEDSVPVLAAAWHYDAPSIDYPAAANTRGRLAWVEDLSGARFLSYDERGNVDWWVRRISDGGATRDHLSRQAYDAMDRVVSRVFPDGDRVEYLYNGRSLLESIPGIVPAIDYHPTGAIASIAYGNGVRTDYSLDPRGRMTGLLTSPASPGDPLQNLAYTLDGVGNVAAIDDLRTLAPGDPTDASRDFAYDDLHRLTGAQGPGYGAVSFSRDAIGNLVFASSPDSPDPGHIDDPLVNLGALAHGGTAGASGRGPRLPGDPPGPHAVTGTASGLAFAYDDNGNMTGNGADSYEWDFRDRLTRALTAMADTRYVYDHAGQRVVKRVLEGGTWRATQYVDAGYELRDGRPVKHLFTGDRRVARVEGRLAGGGATQYLPFEPGWNFFSLEVEPSDPAVDTVLAPLSGAWTGVWAWDPGAGAYVGRVPAQGLDDLAELHAGRGYLIRVTEARALEVAGTPDVGGRALPAGWNLAASPAENAMSVEEAFAAILPQIEAVWGYDTPSASWSAWLPTQPPGLERLSYVEPGRAYWVRLSSGATLPWQARPTRVSYYHPDHLGSSSLTTDAGGAVAERTEFHPFGRVRHEEGPGPVPEYRFTGKERDIETGLDYFGARYYLPVTGSFVGVDPILAGVLPAEAGKSPGPRSGDPRQPDPYAYAAGNPLKFLDPDGRKIKLVFEEGGEPKEKERWRAQEAYVTAKYYLSKSPHAAALIRQLEKSEKTITIQVSYKNMDVEYDADSDTIYWNPKSGLKTKEGGIQSPALGLLHEMGHALHDINDPKRLQQEGESPVPKMKSVEELRVIREFETPVARLLGEPVRNVYGGDNIEVESESYSRKH